MQRNLLKGTIGLAAALAVLAPHAALAAHTFTGSVVHVSMNSIKVHSPQTNETLSFEMWPKFDRIFSRDGKTTYQMRDIKRGRYVEVIYDQKAFGMRHADKIIILK